MLTSYTFDPCLNLNKLFQNTPPSTLQIDNLPQLPTDWLTELENKCREINPYLEKNIFLKHIGRNSKYKLKTALLEQLSYIYYRTSGHLHAELFDHESNKIILLALIEDIEQCTPGFHIRVNTLVNSFQTPTTLNQLLYLVRKNIVQEIACNLTNSVKSIYQVHVADRVSRVAHKQGLGIEPNIHKDRYKSLLSGDKIRQVLNDEFPKHFTPFKIPFLLAEQLQLILNLYRYRGAKETGYATGPAEYMLAIIQFFLTNPAKANTNKLYPFFILDKFDDEFDGPTRIYDLNWHLIRQFFFQKLIEEEFISIPHPANLIDYAYYQALVPEKANAELETKCIQHYLTQQNYAALIEDLNLIQNKFPDYWQTIIKTPIIIKNIDIFFKFLKEQPVDTANAKQLLKKINFTYTLLFSQPKEFVLKKIIVGTKIILTSVNHNLLLKSVKYRHEIIKDFFNILFDTSDKPFQLFFDMLSKPNSDGTNLLMLAGRYQTETIGFILALISKHIDRFTKEDVLSLFLSQNNDGWSFLSLMALHHSDAMQFILDFFIRHPLHFDMEIISTLFLQKNNQGWNFLQLLIRYQPENPVKLGLDFISEKFRFTDDIKWLKLVLNKQQTGYILRLAAQSNHTTLTSILNFTSKHIKHLNDQTLQDFFLDSNDKGWNCLHIAAYNNATNLTLILEFIQQHIDRFNATTLCRLFLAKNQTLHNFLHFAAYYLPADSLEKIFGFIRNNIQLFDKTFLRQLFLQQNSDGWSFLSAAYLDSAKIKIILTFINDHSDKFVQETIKEIILQKNKHDYTCLHLTTRFQPDSLEIILNFIDQRFDIFPDELKPLFQNTCKLKLITTLFRKKNTPAKNLLDLSLKHQPESAAHISGFLDTHAHRFNLKNNSFKSFIDQTANNTVLANDHQKTTNLKTK